MKSLLCVGLSALVMFAVGCSRHERIEAKKDYPDAATGNVKDAKPGSLVVRTPTELVPGEGRDRDLEHAPIAYDVFNERGRLLHNDVRGSVSLPPGKYLVQVEDGKRHPQTFWVSVESGKTTEVDSMAVREGKPAESQVK